MKFSLANYDECVGRFGKDTADAILRQVMGMDVVLLPQPGDTLNCNNKFTVKVDRVVEWTVHVNFEKVL